MKVVRQRGSQPVETIAIRLLDVIAVARELGVEGLDLFSQQSGRRIQCHRIHDEVEQLGFNLKLTLDNTLH